jgi:hypothetical protein
LGFVRSALSDLRNDDRLGLCDARTNRKRLTGEYERRAVGYTQRNGFAVAVRLGMARCLVGYFAQQYDDGMDCDNHSGRDTRRMDDTTVRLKWKNGVVFL